MNHQVVLYRELMSNTWIFCQHTPSFPVPSHCSLGEVRGIHPKARKVQGPTGEPIKTLVNIARVIRMVYVGMSSSNIWDPSRFVCWHWVSAMTTI